MFTFIRIAVNPYVLKGSAKQQVTRPVADASLLEEPKLANPWQKELYRLACQRSGSKTPAYNATARSQLPPPPDPVPRQDNQTDTKLTGLEFWWGQSVATYTPNPTHIDLACFSPQARKRRSNHWFE